MEVCEEMQLLRNYLDVKKIPWRDDSEEFKTSTKDFEMWICRTNFEFKSHHVSVINGFGTYGGWNGANGSDVNLGKLEMMIDENEFNREMKNYEEMIKWLGEHLNELDVMESIVLVGAYKKFAESIAPIFEKHNSVKFTLDYREEK